ANHLPPMAKDRIQGVAAASALSVEELTIAMVLPDLMPILESLAGKVAPGTLIGVSAPRFGCSSFVASGKYFLQGRNLDFPGVAYWDRYPVLQQTSLDGKLRYIGFTTAGVPIGGITGINEAQV